MPPAVYLSLHNPPLKDRRHPTGLQLQQASRPKQCKRNAENKIFFHNLHTVQGQRVHAVSGQLASRSSQPEVCLGPPDRLGHDQRVLKFNGVAQQSVWSELFRV